MAPWQEDEIRPGLPSCSLTHNQDRQGDFWLHFDWSSPVPICLPYKEDRDAELPRQTHVWDNISLLSDSFICLWVFTPGISDSSFGSFSQHTVWMHPKIQNWSCTSLKTSLVSSFLVLSLPCMSCLISFPLFYSTRVFCSHLSSCLVFSPLCYLCFFTSGLFCFLSSNFVKFFNSSHSANLILSPFTFSPLSQVSRCLLTSHFVPFFLILSPLFFCSCLNSSPLFKSNFSSFHVSTCLQSCHVVSSPCHISSCLLYCPKLSSHLVLSPHVSSCLLSSLTCPLVFLSSPSFKITDSSLLSRLVSSPCLIFLSSAHPLSHSLSLHLNFFFSPHMSLLLRFVSSFCSGLLSSPTVILH